MSLNNRTARLIAALDRIQRTDAPAQEQRGSVLDAPDAPDTPLVIRRARALALLLATVPVHIYPDELIVGLPLRETSLATAGDPTGQAAAARVLPPGGVPGLAYVLDAQRLLAGERSPRAYFPDLNAPVAGAGDFRYGLLPHYATATEVREAARFGLGENSNPGHLQAGHARVIELGWNGLHAIASANLDRLDRSAPASAGRAAFLTAAIITLAAARAFALRYAELAEQLAVGEEASASQEGSQRAHELRAIAEVCRNVSCRAPATFQEALQLHWFTHLITMCQGARQLGRFDQYMYPLLAADLACGRIDMAQATGLLECLWVKYNQVTAITEDNLQNMILGGVTPTGDDATNLLTFACLDVTSRLGLVDPKVSVRLHGATPAALFDATARLIAAGRYQPGVYNDEAIIPSLVATGIPLNHARDYTNDGCSELLIQGRTTPWCFEAKVQLLKCLEQVAADLPQYATFDQLWHALLTETALAVEMAISNANLLQAAVPGISPNPFVSATIEGCLESMRDLTEGGALYNPAALCVSGMADTADALAAIRRHVYQEGTVSAQDLTAALAADFAGDERLRLLLLNRAPKFGNNDDEVDALVVALAEHLAACIKGRRNPRGGQYVLGFFSYGDYIGHGMLTGATPDGRHAGTGISANFSPAPGRDAEGPFAVLQSTAKVPPRLTPNGRAVDIALHPSAVSGPDGVAKLAALLRAFVAVGEMQVQFNIIDGQVLRAAQLDPERYRNLTVRLWGFPAHFVSLPREFQDHLIARATH